MNSTQMLQTILNSQEMERYKGFTSLSLPFCLDDGRAASFLCIKANDHSSVTAVGVFALEGENLHFEKADWEPEDVSGDEAEALFSEVEIPEIDEETMKQPGAYGRMLEAFYGDFDIAREAAFTDADDLPDETRAAVVRYLVRLGSFSDHLMRECYAHFGRRFLEWCLDVYYYESMR